MSLLNQELVKFPSPPEGKIGWPWTVGTPADPIIGISEQSFPKISIIIPNFNYGHFLEKAIRSVLLQGYPSLELIIIDNGSTDDSLEIIKKYEHWLTCWKIRSHWGQSRVINDGFGLGMGEIVNWLCSDDYLLPGALRTIGRRFQSLDIDVLVGRCRRVYLNGRRKSWIGRPTLAAVKRIPVNHAFSQSACFYRRKLLDRPKPLDESYHYAMDLELWSYFKSKGVRWKVIEDVLSVYQIHDENKTTTGKEEITREFERIYQKYVNEKIPLTYWHRRLRYPFERFLSRHPSHLWYLVIGPVWLFLTLILGCFYGFDRAWFMRWKRWC